MCKVLGTSEAVEVAAVSPHHVEAVVGLDLREQFPASGLGHCVLTVPGSSAHDRSGDLASTLHRIGVATDLAQRAGVPLVQCLRACAW